MLKTIIRSTFAQNAILNTIATAIPVIILQLVILPILGRNIESSEYGLIITVLSILNVIPATLGNALNNIRLIFNNRYLEEQENGDFQIILLSEAVVNIILVILFSLYYFSNLNSPIPVSFHIFMIVIISILWLCREYYIVDFLIHLDYKKILVNNVLLAGGYIIGCFIVNYMNIWHIWEVIYISGYSASLFYIVSKTDIWKEKLVATPIFSRVFKENNIYIVSCILYRAISYADKMLLFPLLGGSNVTIYYVATLSGKVVNMLIMPLGGVVLAHITKKKEIDLVSFNRMLIYGGGASIIGYGLCVLLSRPILGLLYPQYVDDSMNLIFVTTATICIGVLVSLINPYVLKIKPMKWQAIINGITLILYFISAVILLKSYGLIGFCVGCLIANVMKLFVLVFVFYSSFKEKICN